MTVLVEELPTPETAPLRISKAGDMLSRPPPDWLIYQVLPRQATGLIYGPTRSGKSFLGIDLAHHLALGRPWFGRSVDNKAGVLYLAAEAPGGLSNRIKAWWQHHGIGPDDYCPIFCCEDAIDLRDERIVDDFEKTWAAWANQWDLVIVDTLSCAIPGADENSAEAMSVVVQRMNSLRDCMNAAILLIHHTPKGDKTTPRGSGVLEAGVDMSIQVDRTGDFRTATIRKQREGEEGLLGTFRLRQIETGLDDHARPVTSCVVEQAQEAAAQPTERLTANQQTYLTILQDSMPHGLDGEEWNEKAKSIGMDFTRRQTYFDLKSQLKRKGLVHETQGRWFVTIR
jgi:hypothetical protein